MSQDTELPAKVLRHRYLKKLWIKIDGKKMKIWPWKFLRTSSAERATLGNTSWARLIIIQLGPSISGRALHRNVYFVDGGNNWGGDTAHHWENQSRYTAGWLGGWLAGSRVIIVPLCGSILQAETCQILSLAEYPRWSRVWQKHFSTIYTYTKIFKAPAQILCPLFEVKTLCFVQKLLVVCETIVNVFLHGLHMYKWDRKYFYI